MRRKVQAKERERERFSLECLSTQTPSNPNPTKSILFSRGSKALVAAGLLLRLYFARLSHFHRSHRPPLPPLCRATLDFSFGGSNRKLEARASLLWSTDEGVMVRNYLSSHCCLASRRFKGLVASRFFRASPREFIFSEYGGAVACVSFYCSLVVEYSGFFEDSPAVFPPGHDARASLTLGFTCF
ncbi:hypothetical protein F2Q69_00046097 [Brassica cretica]|uniref:Uncharacterized protein n=1 Tax=Brassica cretica TaxID=69181 RepID=A0A8S9Q5Q0_BRACR|nr:hypothetical protein F2Q69_00046097 [Brassica cretica]